MLVDHGIHATDLRTTLQYFQTFACLEGPVCECYENKKINIANPEYAIQQTIQQQVDNRMYSLVIKVC